MSKYPDSPTAATVDVLTAFDAVAASAREWSALFDRADDVTPFQSAEWLLPWYEIWARDRAYVVTARSSDGSLRAIVPGIANGSRLELGGCGISDYLGPIVREFDAAIFTALDDAIAGSGLTAAFHDLSSTSPWVTVARDMASWHVHAGSVRPIVSLPGTIQAWRDGLPSGLHRNVKRYRTKISNDAGARCWTVQNLEQLAPILESLFELHEKRWHERGRPGVFADADVRRFHVLSAPALLSTGMLRLHVLSAGGTIVGVQYVLHHRARAYSYITGFDPGWSRYSPGTLLMEYAIERAIENGCTEFDMLRGAEEYKYAWGSIDRATVVLTRNADMPPRAATAT